MKCKRCGTEIYDKHVELLAIFADENGYVNHDRNAICVQCYDKYETWFENV